MNIIISPAKKMNVCNDDLTYKSMPSMIEKTEILSKYLKDLSYDNFKKLLCCNDDIATLNFDRFSSMDLYSNLTPALLAYDGIQYKYMSPSSFTYEELDYVNKHLKILSGFYGIVKPFDGVVPYRLEMQAKLKYENYKNLYDFWGDSIYKEVTKDSNIILNLASKEYSKAVEKYITPNDKLITCIFGTITDSKIKVKATEAKMARGLMTRYLAQNNIDNVEDTKHFSDLSFTYSEKHSTPSEFVFLK